MTRHENEQARGWASAPRLTYGWLPYMPGTCWHEKARSCGLSGLLAICTFILPYALCAPDERQLTLK